VLRGTLPTGETIELHETTLMPEQMPHPPHKHVHTELMLIREGTVEFLMDDKTERIGPGGVAYAASNTLHGLKNVGTIPANYFVIAIGIEPAHG
jgi:mannose-6-phosphate isomerase-like protein (cupin superfamily)